MCGCVNVVVEEKKQPPLSERLRHAKTMASSVKMCVRVSDFVDEMICVCEREGGKGECVYVCVCVCERERRVSACVLCCSWGVVSCGIFWV